MFKLPHIHNYSHISLKPVTGISNKCYKSNWIAKKTKRKKNIELEHYLQEIPIEVTVNWALLKRETTSWAKEKKIIFKYTIHSPLPFTYIKKSSVFYFVVNTERHTSDWWNEQTPNQPASKQASNNSKLSWIVHRLNLILFYFFFLFMLRLWVCVYVFVCMRMIVHNIWNIPAPFGLYLCVFYSIWFLHVYIYFYFIFYFRRVFFFTFCSCRLLTKHCVVVLQFLVFVPSAKNEFRHTAKMFKLHRIEVNCALLLQRKCVYFNA